MAHNEKQYTHLYPQIKKAQMLGGVPPNAFDSSSRYNFLSAFQKKRLICQSDS